MKQVYSIVKTMPPTCDTPPPVRKRQKTMVVISKKTEGFGENIVMLIAKSKLTRTLGFEAFAYVVWLS